MDAGIHSQPLLQELSESSFAEQLDKSRQPHQAHKLEGKALREKDLKGEYCEEVDREPARNIVLTDQLLVTDDDLRILIMIGVKESEDYIKVEEEFYRPVENIKREVLRGEWRES